jgi:chromate reductase
MFPVNRPEVLIAGVDRKFDAEGRLTDETTRKILAQLLQALADWTERLRAK